MDDGYGCFRDEWHACAVTSYCYSILEILSLQEPVLDRLLLLLACRAEKQDAAIRLHSLLLISCMRAHH